MLNKMQWSLQTATELTHYLVKTPMQPDLTLEFTSDGGDTWSSSPTTCDVSAKWQFSWGQMNVRFEKTRPALPAFENVQEMMENAIKTTETEILRFDLDHTLINKNYAGSWHV